MCWWSLRWRWARCGSLCAGQPRGPGWLASSAPRSGRTAALSTTITPTIQQNIQVHCPWAYIMYRGSNRTQPAISSPFILWFFNEIVSRKPLSPCVVKVLYEQLSDFSNGLYVNKSLLRSNELVQWRERSPVPMMRRTWTNATCNFSRSDHNAFKHCYVIKY